MLSPQKFRELALAFNNVEEQPHFHRQSFRVKKKIFATLDEEKHTATLKLPEAEQSVFCKANAEHIRPATGAWGRQGWTIFELKHLPRTLVADALAMAYDAVSGKKK